MHAVIAMSSVVLATCGCASVSPPTSTGPPTSASDLLGSTFAQLDELGSLDAVAKRAESTPGIRAVHHAADERTLVIILDEAMSGLDVADLGGWEDVFLVQRRDRLWSMMVFDSRHRVGHRFQEVTFVLPRHGEWNVLAIATDRPSGPAPEINSGTSGAYPLEDYYFAIERIIIQPAPGH